MNPLLTPLPQAGEEAKEASVAPILNATLRQFTSGLQQPQKVKTLSEQTTPEKDKPTQEETPSEETEKDKTPPSIKGFGR